MKPLFRSSKAELLIICAVFTVTFTTLPAEAFRGRVTGAIRNITGSQPKPPATAPTFRPGTQSGATAPSASASASASSGKRYNSRERKDVQNAFLQQHGAETVNTPRAKQIDQSLTANVEHIMSKGPTRSLSPRTQGRAEEAIRQTQSLAEFHTKKAHKAEHAAIGIEAGAVGAAAIAHTVAVVPAAGKAAALPFHAVEHGLQTGALLKVREVAAHQKEAARYQKIEQALQRRMGVQGSGASQQIATSAPVAQSLAPSSSFGSNGGSAFRGGDVRMTGPSAPLAATAGPRRTGAYTLSPASQALRAPAAAGPQWQQP